MTKPRALKKGFSTLELLIAMGTITTSLSAVIMVVFSNQTVSLDNQLNNEALIKIDSFIEQAKSSASFDFNSLTYSSASDNIFKKELLITDVNSCKKTGLASVSWSTDQRPLHMEIGTVFSNPNEAIALGGDCGPDLPPAPTAFQNITCKDNDATFDFSPSGAPATGLDLIKRGTDKFAVISSNPSSANGKDLWIVNVNNKAALVSAVSSLDIGPGLNDVDVVGNYAFGANDATTKQLAIIDITNLALPNLIASISLNTVGAGSEGRVVYYYDDKIYMGTNYLVSYDEFQIFDVTNRSSPTLISGGSYNVNHHIYDIKVRDEVVGGVARTLAYLAVSDAVGNKPKLIVLDVTNPSLANPITLFGSFNPTPNDTLYGTVLTVLGDRVYFGRERATGSSHDLFILDVSDPSAISILDSAQIGMNSGNEVRGIIVSGNLMFVSVSKSNGSDELTFQVWDVTNPRDMKLISNCNYPQDALDFEFDGDYIYTANSSNKALRIIYDSTNPFP